MLIQICLPKPATASSTALSSASQTRCSRPEVEVEPIYIPGRCRMAAMPSSTWISAAEYVPTFFGRDTVFPAVLTTAVSTTSLVLAAAKSESCSPVAASSACTITLEERDIYPDSFHNACAFMIKPCGPKVKENLGQKFHIWQTCYFARILIKINFSSQFFNLFLMVRYII